MPGQRFARQRRACGQPGARTPRPTTIPRPVPQCAWRPAADNLAAGRDLLHTPFTTDQSGWRHGTSPWAPAIASRQVNGALAGEIGGYTEHLAAGALQAAAAGSAERLPACCASLRMETRRHAFEQDRTEILGQWRQLHERRSCGCSPRQPWGQHRSPLQTVIAPSGALTHGLAADRRL